LRRLREWLDRSRAGDDGVAGVDPAGGGKHHPELYYAKDAARLLA